MSANQVGIVAALSTALAELGADLQEVSQTVMHKFFTIILAADFPTQHAPQKIVEHIRQACAQFHVDLVLKDPDLESPQPPPVEGTEKYFLTMTGSNTPGIIRTISRRLAEERIDIEDLYAVKDEQAGSFVMILELAIPCGMAADSLLVEIENLGQSVGLTAALQHENIFRATNDPRPVRIARRPSPTRLAN